MIVETGDVVENANSYCTVDFADDYFSARGDTEWSALSDSEKEVYLIKGTDFIDSSFDWHGKKSDSSQDLNFPRTNLYDKNGDLVEGIPLSLKKAVCVAAKLVSDGNDLFETHESNGAVVSESIGSISYSYNPSLKEKDVTLYDSINLLLRGLYVDHTKQKIVPIKVGRVL